MASNFLDALPLREEDRAKLTSFGASSAYALLAMRKASKNAFDNYLGRDRADEIAGHLDGLLTSEQRESLMQPSIGGAGRLGARLSPPPVTPSA